MTGAGVSDVGADEVGTDIVADVCSYPDQKKHRDMKTVISPELLVRMT